MRQANERFVPCCFDGVESELAVSIVSKHHELVTAKGFNPELTQQQLVETTGRVLSVVSSAFCTIFGEAPADRYGDVFDQVASFASRLSRDHIFPDANKRTTVVASLGILALAGVGLEIEDAPTPEENELYLWIQDVVINKQTQEELAERLRKHARRITI